jgi:hypothetical protein
LFTHHERIFLRLRKHKSIFQLISQIYNKLKKLLTFSIQTGLTMTYEGPCMLILLYHKMEFPHFFCCFQIVLSFFLFSIWLSTNVYQFVCIFCIFNFFCSSKVLTGKPLHKTKYYITLFFEFSRQENTYGSFHMIIKLDHWHQYIQFVLISTKQHTILMKILKCFKNTTENALVHH